MLIITRKVGESILIDNTTEITILSRSGNYIRIGVKAPEDVLISRKEKITKGIDNESCISSNH